MDLGMSGRVALVTGADSGIGWHTARMLSEAGARVAITDQHEKALAAAAEALPGAVLAVVADLTVAEDLRRLHDTVLDNLGSPEILVHAAGITGGQGLFHELAEEDWRKTLDVDFFAAVSLVRAFIDDMRPAGRGRIVLLASEDAVQPYADELPYCAAKAATLALMKGLSKTYAAEGILVNAVSPAFIATPMTDAMMDKRAEENGTDRDEAIRSFLDEERPFIELKRRGLPEEVAAVIAFLCSEHASFINGSNYRVDSGSVATI
jgi:NAD(P)-dependent dehydrogenase (short-subunit alcohol dehydrogenase family)